MDRKTGILIYSTTIIAMVFMLSAEFVKFLDTGKFRVIFGVLYFALLLIGVHYLYNTIKS